MKISLDQAKDFLRKKGIPIGLPTETVYGLSVSIDDEEGIKKIFSLKNRNSSHPLSIQIANYLELKKYVSFLPEKCQEIAEAFWPGPLTLVLPVKEKNVSSLIRGHLPTVGIRIPDHPLTLSLIKEVGPIISTSANITGFSPCIDADEVEKIFGYAFPVLDGGKCKLGISSTILTFQEKKWQIVREGALCERQLIPFLS